MKTVSSDIKKTFKITMAINRLINHVKENDC